MTEDAGRWNGALKFQDGSELPVSIPIQKASGELNSGINTATALLREFSFTVEWYLKRFPGRPLRSKKKRIRKKYPGNRWDGFFVKLHFPRSGPPNN